MRRVAIIGSAGQLGTDCVRAFHDGGWDTVALDRERAELLDPDSLLRAIDHAAPDVVVNTAAMTDVPGCEADPERAFRINALGARNVAMAAGAARTRLLHLSTDYVFDGGTDRPYTEDDLPRPLNVYGNTKLSGEHFVLAHAGEAAIVRTSGLYGRAPCRGKGGRNFVRTMLAAARERGSVTVVSDEMVTPTYTLDLAWQLVVLADSSVEGIVHATCQGECSWYQFARAIFDIAGVTARITEASVADFPSPVTRPPYSVLDNMQLREHGLDRMPDWRESLQKYLGEIGERPTLAVTREPR